MAFFKLNGISKSVSQIVADVSGKTASSTGKSLSTTSTTTKSTGITSPAKTSTAGSDLASTTKIGSESKAIDGIAGGGADALKATSSSSSLGNLAKYAGVAGIGVIAATVAGGLTAINAETPVISTRAEEDGTIRYEYETGIAAVNEAVNWLQQQIDEIVDFLNSLFGGSSGGGGAAGGYVASGSDETATTGSKWLPILAVVGVLAAIGIVVWRTKEKKGAKR